MNQCNHKTLIEKGNEIQKTTPSANKKRAYEKEIPNKNLKRKLKRPGKGKSGKKGGEG